MPVAYLQGSISTSNCGAPFRLPWSRFSLAVQTCDTPQYKQNPVCGCLSGNALLQLPDLTKHYSYDDELRGSARQFISN